MARAGPGAIWRDGGRYVKTKESRSLGQWLVMDQGGLRIGAKA